MTSVTEALAEASNVTLGGQAVSGDESVKFLTELSLFCIKLCINALNSVLNFDNFDNVKMRSGIAAQDTIILLRVSACLTESIM